MEKVEKIEKKQVNRISVQQILVSHEKRIQELEKIIQEMKQEQEQGENITPSNIIIQSTAPNAPYVSTNLIL
jgi:hypothetical protein